MVDTLRKADVISLEIRQPEFWQEKQAPAGALPRRGGAAGGSSSPSSGSSSSRTPSTATNAEKQKNLVMLGTAASTLAHEIKNPLLAIRLQTGILSRVLSGEGGGSSPSSTTR